MKNRIFMLGTACLIVAVLLCCVVCFQDLHQQRSAVILAEFAVLWALLLFGAFCFLTRIPLDPRRHG